MRDDPRGAGPRGRAPSRSCHVSRRGSRREHGRQPACRSKPRDASAAWTSAWCLALSAARARCGLDDSYATRALPGGRDDRGRRDGRPGGCSAGPGVRRRGLPAGRAPGVPDHRRLLRPAQPGLAGVPVGAGGRRRAHGDADGSRRVPDHHPAGRRRGSGAGHPAPRSATSSAGLRSGSRCARARPMLPVLPLVLAMVLCIALGTESPSGLLVRGPRCSPCWCCCGWCSGPRGCARSGTGARGRIARAVGRRRRDPGRRRLVVAVLLPPVGPRHGWCCGAGSGPVRTSASWTTRSPGSAGTRRQPKGTARQRRRQATAAGHGPAARSRLLRYVALDTYDGTTWSAGNRTVENDSLSLFQRIGEQVGARRPGRQRATCPSRSSGPGRAAGCRSRASSPASPSTTSTGDAQRTDVRYNVATQTGHGRRRARARRTTTHFTAVAGRHDPRPPRCRPTATATRCSSGGRLPRPLRAAVEEVGPDADAAGVLPGEVPAGQRPVQRRRQPASSAATCPGTARPGWAPSSSARRRSSVTTSSTPRSWPWPPTGSAYRRASWSGAGRTPRAGCAAATCCAWVELRVADGSWRILPPSTFMSHRPPKRSDTLQPPANFVRSDPGADDAAQEAAAARTAARRSSRDPAAGRLRRSARWSGWSRWDSSSLVGRARCLKWWRRRRRQRVRRISRRVVGAWEEVLDLAATSRGRWTDGAAAGRAGASPRTLSVPLARRVDDLVFARDEPTAEEAREFWRRRAPRTRRRAARASAGPGASWRCGPPAFAAAQLVAAPTLRGAAAGLCPRPTPAGRRLMTR